MSEDTVPVCKFLLGEQEHLPKNQLIVIKESIMINTVTIQQNWNIFPIKRGFFPNAKLYRINLNYFLFDKYNQCSFLLLVKIYIYHIYAEQYLKFPLII